MTNITITYEPLTDFFGNTFIFKEPFSALRSDNLLDLLDRLNRYVPESEPLTYQLDPSVTLYLRACITIADYLYFQSH
jgi:hypothetical protein